MPTTIEALERFAKDFESLIPHVSIVVNDNPEVFAEGFMQALHASKIADKEYPNLTIEERKNLIDHLIQQRGGQMTPELESFGLDLMNIMYGLPNVN